MKNQPQVIHGKTYTACSLRAIRAVLRDSSYITLEQYESLSDTQIIQRHTDMTIDRLVKLITPEGTYGSLLLRLKASPVILGGLGVLKIANHMTNTEYEPAKSFQSYKDAVEYLQGHLGSYMESRGITE